MSATTLLKELLRVDSTNPPGNERPCAELLEGRLGGAGLETKLFESPTGRVSLIARAEGRRDLPALVLLSHTDVVGVEPDKWSHDPFGGEEGDGFIWGRGALDMKSVGVMHAEAAATASDDPERSREIIVVAVADEEAGGHEGAEWLLHDHAEQLGFSDDRPPPEVLGEGGMGLLGVFGFPFMPIVLGEKLALWVQARATGFAAHGSMPPAESATERLAAFIRAVSGFGPARLHPVMRAQFAAVGKAERGIRSTLLKGLATPVGPTLVRILAARLRREGPLGSLISDTAAVTTMSAGYKHNVVPGEATASFDCRLLPDTSPDAYLTRLQDLGRKHSVEVTEKLRTQGPVSPRTGLWSLLADVTRKHFPTAVTVPSLTPGITDLRYFRARGGIAYGWVPLMLTRELLDTIHGHDERIPIDGFETAVAAMSDAVVAVARNGSSRN